VVVGFAIPASRRRSAIDVQVLLFVRGDQLMPISQRLRVLRQCAIERLPFRRDETNGAVIEHENHNVAFMHVPMVEPAETDEI